MPDNNDGNMTEKMNNNPDPNYWRSFEELHNDKSFIEQVENEFKEGASESPDLKAMSPLSRRKFLALLGASAAFAGTACTDYRDKGNIIPYNKKPEQITIGKANYYASTCDGCSAACGILIKTREGRPVKIDGNPDHPVSQGKVCAQGQAGVMALYDPDRLQTPLKRFNNRFEEISWKKADALILKALNEAGDKEIAIVTSKIVSPTENKVLNEFAAKFPTTKVYSYEQFNDSVRNDAWKKCYGDNEFPAIKWNKAKIIVSLDSDFLGLGGNKIENARLFAEGRDIMHKKFNRLYAIESTLSVTGMNADYRLRLRPELQYDFVMSVINELSNKNIIDIPFNTSRFSLSKFADENKLSKKDLFYLVDDLAKNRGKSIVYAGDHLPEKVHVAVNLLNEYLSNTKLYETKSLKLNVRDLSSYDELNKLVSGMKNGKVGVVIHYGTNPAYNFPADLDYKNSLKNVDLVISFTDLLNESTALSNYVLPVHHHLESWGDAKTRTGFYSLRQPVISPVYDTRQKEAILLNWISGKEDSFDEKFYHDYLMDNWKNQIYPKLKTELGFESFWFGALHDGVVKSNDSISVNYQLNESAASLLSSERSNPSGFALHITESYSVRDGKFANNGWLQELPHPVSKVTWDNYAAISINTANELNLKSNDIVEITIGNHKTTIPVFIQPGAADKTLTIETGFGRTNSGRVAENVGFNVNKIQSVSNGISPWLFTNVNVKKVNGFYKLVTSQVVYNFTDPLKKDLPQKRDIIQEGTVKEYLENPYFLISEEEKLKELPSVNPPIPYPGLKWGMAIDMNKCLGCGDCVIACNVENNIPVVGKDQVDVGREMQWLRIDRYYSGSVEEPKVSNQMMICQQCDQAPCENVCPVAATTHSPDGLNQMVYNRCVGTRYCSNNCPYKVRRFNFFNFRDHFRDGYQESPVFALLQNPEVTVRSRGVMEKCTFCVQRIAEARADATREGKQLKGSDVKTACQEACGTNAIKFGDINNKDEEFYKYRNHELGYYVLEELNIKPNVTYLAKLRNTHSEDA